jgi:DNA helicase-2/ATP-dependent DNA helicase PcrA
VAAAPIEEILGHVLSQTGYHAMLERDETEDGLDRLANIEELLTAARQFDEIHPGEGHLEEFLEDASLVNDTDAWADADDRATLMTLHASKGLEFPVVFIVAVEEGILPHERSRDNIDQLEEERRLLFVGMTRAEQELSLSQSAYRDFRGQRRPTIPSQFLMELPRGEMELIGARWLQSASASGAHYDALESQEPPSDGDGLDEPPNDAHDAAPRSDEALLVSQPALEAGATDFDFGAEGGGSTGKGAAPGVPAESARAAAAPGAGARLTTASQLVGAPPADALPPLPAEVFRQDMLVTHPEYGLGRIVALSGAGPRRQATVMFVAGAGSKKFFLSKSALRPAR